MAYYLTEILKISRFHQTTSVSIPYVYSKNVYCVQFLENLEWFEDLDEAEAYAASLYEKWFFLLEDILEKQQLHIKVYNIRKL